MIERIIHQTVPAGRLSWEERRYQRRIFRNLPDWEHRIWTDDANARLFQEQFPQYDVNYSKIRFGVIKADISRYVYMHAFGGFYFDTDYRLIKGLPQDIMQAACVIPIEEATDSRWGFKLGNSVLGSGKGHPFWSGLIAFLFERMGPQDVTDRDQIVDVSGPGALTLYYEQVRHLYTDIVTPARDEFHPDRRFFGTTHGGDENTIGMHQCWGSWRGKPLIGRVRNQVRRKLNAL